MILWIAIFIFIFVFFILTTCKDKFSNILESRCVFVLSVGDRSKFLPLRKSQQDYAKHCGAKYLLFSYPSLEDVPSEYTNLIDFYNPNNTKFRIRMLKLAILSKILRKYDRVLLLDDTCYVSPNTPNLFNIVPQKSIGLARELGELSHCTRFNSGVLLAPSSFANIIENLEQLYNESNIAIKNNSLKWCGVDQTLLNYILKDSQIFYLDPRFNAVSSQITDKSIINKEAYIYHLTGTNDDRSIRFINLLMRNP